MNRLLKDLAYSRQNGNWPVIRSVLFVIFLNKGITFAVFRIEGKVLV